VHCRHGDADLLLNSTVLLVAHHIAEHKPCLGAQSRAAFMPPWRVKTRPARPIGKTETSF
ncbi:MAG: hypothetical protein WCI11_11965, partial [Candidatus Methylumidiphilus sp.]